MWRELVERVGLANAQQFWDHVAHSPGAPPKVGSACVLKGKAGQPRSPGYSRTIHYEITGAGRIDYQYNPQSTEGRRGDAHGVVRILTIDLSSH